MNNTFSSMRNHDNRLIMILIDIWIDCINDKSFIFSIQSSIESCQFYTSYDVGSSIIITFGSLNKLRAMAIRYGCISENDSTCFCPPLIPTPRSPTDLQNSTISLSIRIQSIWHKSSEILNVHLIHNFFDSFFWHMLQFNSLSNTIPLIHT